MSISAACYLRSSKDRHDLSIDAQRRALHDYALADLTTVLGKSASTLSEILSLNKLPAEVKDDCRNDPKAGRSILVLIAS